MARHGEPLIIYEIFSKYTENIMLNGKYTIINQRKVQIKIVINTRFKA